MKNEINVLDYAAVLGFILMVPGYVVYHNLYLIDILPSLFDGISTPLAIISSIGLIIGLIIEISKRNYGMNFGDIIFFLFSSIFFVVVVFHYRKGTNLNLSLVHIATLFQFLVYYIIFRRLALNLKRWRWVFISCTILIAFTIVVGPSQGLYVDFDFSLQEETINFRDYQGYALAIVISGLCAAATIDRYSYRIPMYLLVLAALFFNGARTEFFLAAMVIIPSELILSEARFKSFALILAGGVTAISAVVAMQFLLQGNPARRIVEFIIDPFGDASYLERAAANAYGLATVEASPFFGDYGSYPVGLYAHNIISSWVDLGLLGFLVYALNVYAPVIGGFRRWLAGADIARLLLPLALLMGVSVVASKAFTYKLIGVLAGVYGASLVNANVEPRSRPRISRRGVISHV